MSKKLTIELPNEVYESLRTISRAAGRSVEDVASEYVGRCTGSPRPRVDQAESRDAWRRLERFQGAVDSGDPQSADNDRIDADLAREYANPHEDGQ